MQYIKCLSSLTPDNMINARYYDAKNICNNIWDRPNFWFDDIFHKTMFNCLNTLDRNKKYSYDYLKNYFFQAFRINMIRFYGYAFNKYRSGQHFENILIKSEDKTESRMDGHQMLDFVKCKYGQETRDMLWDSLQGYTYKELNNKYDTNSAYYLGKIKDELKNFYKKEDLF